MRTNCCRRCRHGGHANCSPCRHFCLPQYLQGRFLMRDRVLGDEVPEGSCGVYALSLDGTTYRYVGITRRSFRERMWGHYRDVRKGSALPVHAWMRKHGIENVVMTVLQSTSVADLAETERVWITTLRETGFSLLNLTSGGDGCWEPTDELRERLSASRRGRKLSKEHVAAAVEGRKRSPKPPLTPERSAVFRRVITDEQKAALSERLKGKPLSEEHKAKLREAHARRSSYRKCAEETKRKIGAANKGRVKSPEEIQKRKDTMVRKKAQRLLAEGGASRSRS